MTTIVILILVVFVIVIAWRSRRPARGDGQSVMLGLRAQFLHLSAADVGIEPAPGQAWAVVMDMAYPNGAATLVSAIDGTASIYFSSGGGVIGGQAHEQVANAAIAFVRRATEFLGHTTPAANEDLPAPGNTRFFIRTSDGTRMAEAPENELGSGSHALSPLFHAGQDVITQLRLVSEAQQAG